MVPPKEQDYLLSMLCVDRKNNSRVEVQRVALTDTDLSGVLSECIVAFILGLGFQSSMVPVILKDAMRSDK